MRTVLGVVPARYASTRFPGKPLAVLKGKTLIERVVCQAEKALARVVVATDDKRIFKAVSAFGGHAILTSRRCQSGTDRMWEVARKIPARYYVNIQGDEPFIDPNVIRRAVKTAIQKRSVTTAAVRLDPKKADDANVVKVVMDREGRALYFSRSRIPFSRDRRFRSRVYKHIGLYVFPRKALRRFVRRPPGPLEKAERLEQLRVLTGGEPIYVVVTRRDSIGIDTPADLKRAAKII